MPRRAVDGDARELDRGAAAASWAASDGLVIAAR